MKRPISHTSARLTFFGSESAELFTHEVNASLQGVLQKNLIGNESDPNAGFVSASIDGRPWTNTMWTRDAGTFLRELVHWGYLDQACLVAGRLIDLVEPNPDGFYTFPMYFELGKRGSGSELDGTCAILIGLVQLWERLERDHPARGKIAAFLQGTSSPLVYYHHLLEEKPFLPGTGEFGGGLGMEGVVFNVVQNNLARLAFLAAAGFEAQLGRPAWVDAYRRRADQLAVNMPRYFRAQDGGWVWTIDGRSLQPDPAINENIINKGTGGLNGPLAMSADVEGLEPMRLPWEGAQAGLCTFERLYSVPRRKALFEKYGVWTQFDEFILGAFTSPSYGHCYALQAMLLMDRLEMAGKALDFLAQVTFRPFPHNHLDRDSEYYFYERIYLPELIGHEEEMRSEYEVALGTPHFDQGCGALNLVNVAEPLKVARLVVGVDDLDPSHLKIVPRLPPGWSGYRAEGWPVLTPQGLLHVDLECRREDGRLRLHIEPREKKIVPALAVRFTA